MRSFYHPIALATLLLASLGTAQAHQVWLENDGGQAQLFFGEFNDNLRETSPGALDKFLATPTLYAFAFLGAALRGAGDSRTPFRFLLLSVALIVVPTRDKRLAWALFQCLVGGLSFLVVNGYCEVMGLAGEISPWLAVVAAPLAFAWIGLDRLLRADGAS